MSAAVHVVVVSYRTPRLLDRGLRALHPSVVSGLVSVTVVDNAPGDGSAELVRERHGWATLLEPGRNLGFGPAVTLGARSSRAPWIVAANADVAVEPGAIEALLAAGARDDRAGVLAPRLLRPDGTTQHSVHPFPTVRFAAAFNLGLVERSPRLRRQLVLEGWWDPAAGRRVPWAHGALLLVRREAWEAIDGFDPQQWMYSEDVDLCWRAGAAGWATRYVPEARVRHEVSAATGPVWGDGRTRRATAAGYRWLARRRSPAVAATVATLNVLGATARLVLGTAPGRASHRHWLRAHLAGARDALHAERPLD